MDESIPPKKKDTIDLKIDKKKLLAGVLVSLALVLTILAILQSKKNSGPAVASPTPTITVTVSISPSATTTKTKIATATPESTPQSVNIDAEAAKVPARGVLNAMLNRNLADAKAFMTSSYYGSLSQDSFASTSSPSRDRYDIISSQYFEGARVYEVKAKMYMKLAGADAGYFDVTFYVIGQNSTYLVNNMTQEEHTQ